MDRFKYSVKQIGEQNISEKPTENAIIAALKSAIQNREPALYQLAYLHDMQLDKIYQQIVKNVTVKKKVENYYGRVAASLPTIIKLFKTRIGMRRYSGHLEKISVAIDSNREDET